MWGFVFVSLANGWIHRNVLTDWVGFAVDEGFTAYGAQRVREGQVPHRDFFFLWTPGILYLHALLQELGASAAGERMASLAASVLSGVLALRWGRRLGLVRAELAWLALLLAAWSFPLWNVPYSSWFAIALALVAVECGRRSWLLAGLVYAGAFWFKQNVGILAAGGSALWLLADAGSRRRVLELGAGLGVGIALPFLGFAIAGGGAAAQAFSQIFVFPFTYRMVMAEPLPEGIFSWPCIFTGVWVLSLYLQGATEKVRLWSRAAAVVVVCVALSRQGRDFFLGMFFLWSMLGWLFSFVLLAAAPAARRRAAAFLLLPAAGAFLQVYPRWDYQHFLFSFPLAALALCLGLHELRLRYPTLPKAWPYLPVIVLFVAGAFFQGRLIFLHRYGSVDPVGFVSAGEGQRLNGEMAAVKDYLVKLGLRPGDPILVMPNATSFYRFSGFRNPTPHDQFFPRYVEAFGASEETVLDRYEAAGGAYVVLQRHSRLGFFAPVLERYLQAGYEEIKQFPEHFSVWRKLPARGIDSP